jgi:hypothetical protein
MDVVLLINLRADTHGATWTGVAVGVDGVAATAGSLLELRRELRRQLERRVGPDVHPIERLADPRADGLITPVLVAA